MPCTRKLQINSLVGSDLPELIAGDLEHSLPTKRDVLHVLGAMPNLESFTIKPRAGEEEDEELEYDVYNLLVKMDELESVFFPALTSPSAGTPRLRYLNLYDRGFDGKDLVKVLNTHRFSLRSVDLRQVALTGAQQRPVTWRKIYTTILKINLDELVLEGLRDPGQQVPYVLLNWSDGDGPRDQWSTVKPAPKNLHGSKDSKDSELGYTDEYAVFTRTRATLAYSWVKKGLQKLLGRTAIKLYHDPIEEE